jgi:hypothetical protein
MTPKRPITVVPCAKRVGVDPGWLQHEAEQGRIPHVRAGDRFLFDPTAVQRVLAERAGREGLVEMTL